MIRFGVIVTVVVAAVGLLIVGAVAGELALVYGSIALAALALLLLIVGVAVWRDQVFASAGRRGERSLAAVGAVGQAGPAVEGWPELPGAMPPPGPAPSAGPSGQGRDARQFTVPIGAGPARDAPADRDRRSGEPRPAEAPSRAGDARAGDARAGDTAARAGRDAGYQGDWASREPAAADWAGREPAAADWAGREPASPHRSDRADRYPAAAGPERFEPTDDPTRLAHRLDSLADLGRPAADPAGRARPQAARSGGQRAPAKAGNDALAGPGGERMSAPADPLSASPAKGRAALPTAGPERGAGARADAPERGTGARPDAAERPRPSATVSSAAAPPPTAPAAASPGTTAPATTKDLGSRAPEIPAGSGDGQAVAASAGAANESGAPTGTGPGEPGAAKTSGRDSGSDAAPAVGLDDQVSIVPGIARYHKADCILIRFLSEDDLQLMSRRDAEAASNAPCRACRPDKPAAAD